MNTDSVKSFNYFIVDGYTINKPEHCSLDPESAPYGQQAVYEWAFRIVRENGLQRILDIGCGLGVKLNRLFGPICDFVGVDIQQRFIDSCQSHQYGTWLWGDVTRDRFSIKGVDLIICADVVEHMPNPDGLFGAFIRCAKDKNTFVIMSTPERVAMRGEKDMGPPENLAHIREWKFDEFQQYIDFHASIDYHGLVPSDGRHQDLLSTQLVEFKVGSIKEVSNE